MRNMTINEFVSVIIEKFRLQSFKIVDIDKNDILWSSINDSFGLSWDIKTQNIRIYYEGLQECFLSKYNIDKGLADIEYEYYDELIDEMVNSLIIDEEILKEIQKRLNKCVLFENYEEASLIKNFLKLFS